MKRYIYLFLFFCAFSIKGIAQTTDTIVLQPGPEGKDTEVRTDFPNQSNGNSMDFIANAWTAGGNFFVQRSYIRFDLSMLPANAVIHSAILQLTTNLITGHYQMDSGPNESYFMRVLSDWNELMTWNTQPDITETDKIYVHQSTSNTETYQIEMTGHVQDMVEHPETNYGWQFRLKTEDKFRCLAFSSSDHPYPEWRPRLTIIYTACMPPSSDFSYMADNLDVTFTPVQTNAISWLWEFGDGTNSGAQSPVHSYLTPGTYNVQLTVSDSCGETVTTKTLTVGCTPIQETFAFSANGKTVSFTESLPQGQVPSRHWDFGDGAISSDYNPVHVYNSNGIYPVCLTVTDECGSSVFCDTVELICPDQTIYFTTDMYFMTVQFYDTTTSNTVISHFWDFGDGFYSAEHNPVHEYPDTAVFYKVCLTITDSCSAVTFCDSIFINPPPEPLIVSHQQEENDLLVSFEAQAYGATAYNWTFGDGTSSGLQNPVHQYQSYGDYSVCLAVSNPAGSSSACDTISVKTKILYDEKGLKLFPNPSDGIIKIKFGSDRAEVMIKIINSLGSTVLTTQKDDLPSNSPVVLDLTGFASGIYFVKIESGEISCTEKLVLK